MAKTWWKSGSWNAICDICARKYKAEELKLNWRGQMVCREDWEPRNQQELIRPIKDMNKLPWTRPRGTNQFVTVTPAAFPGCTGLSIYCQAAFGQAGCMTVGTITGGLLES